MTTSSVIIALRRSSVTPPNTAERLAPVNCSAGQRTSLPEKIALYPGTPPTGTLANALCGTDWRTRLPKMMEKPIKTRITGKNSLPTIRPSIISWAESSSTPPTISQMLLPVLGPFSTILIMAGIMMNRVHQPSKKMSKSQMPNALPAKPRPAMMKATPHKTLPILFRILYSPHIINHRVIENS